MEIEDYIKARIKYVEQSGALIWRSTLGRAKAGAPAEQRASNGYLQVQVSVAGKRYRFMSHRVVWLLVNGFFPSGVIDHIDRDKSNNRIANLRDCTQSVNLTRKASRNRTLPRGVCFSPAAGKGKPYVAQLCGRTLGYFKTPVEAGAAYRAAWRERTGEISWPQM